MANYDINEVVSPKALSDIQKLETQTGKVVANILKIYEAAKQTDTSLSKMNSTNVKKLNTETKKAAESNEKLNKSTVKLSNLQTNYMKTLTSLAKQKERNTKLTRAEIAANESGAGSYKKMSLELSKNIQEYQRLSKAERENAAVGGKLLTRIHEQDTSLKKLDATMGRSQRSVGNYTGALRGFGRQLMGALGITAGVFMFIRAVKDTFNRIREFDKAMQNMAGIAQTSRRALAGVSRAIRFVAKTSLRTSNQVAQLATVLFTLGRTKKEVIQMLKPVNDLSIALGSASDETADFLGQTLNAFGKGADSAQRFADIIANIRGKTALNFERIKDAFGFILPTADALNMTVGGIGATIGILQNNGVKAARAGRLLNTSFARLIKRGLTLKQALDKINNSTNKVRTANDLFGARSFALGLILAKNIKKTKKLADEFDNMSKGSLKKLTDEQLESMDAKMKILNSTWENFILGIDRGNGIISRSVRGIVSGLTGFINLLAKLDGQGKATVNGMRQQQQQVNILAVQLTAANIPASERVKIMKKIKDLAPDVVKGLKSENIALGTLRENLEKYNQAFVKKIAMEEISERMQKSQKKLGEQLSILEDRKAAFIKQMLWVQKSVAKTDKAKAERLEKEILSADTLAEKFKKIQQILKSGKDSRLVLSDYASAYTDVVRSQLIVGKLQKNLTDKTKEYYARYKDIYGIAKKLTKEQKESLKTIGAMNKIQLTKFIETKKAEVKAGDKFSALQVETAKKRIKIIEDAEDIIKKEAAIAAEKTRQLFLSEKEKQLEAIDKKAKALLKEGLKEVDVARWVAEQKAKINADYYQKIKTQQEKADKEREKTSKAMFAKIKVDEEANIPDSATSLATSPAVTAMIKRVQAIKKIAQAAADNRVDIAHISMQEIDNLYKDNVITFKEHEELKTKILTYQEKVRMQNRISAMQFTQQLGNILMNGLMDSLQAQQQALDNTNRKEMDVFDQRKKRIEDEKKRELALAKGNASRIAQINKKAADDEAKLDGEKLKSKTAYDKKVAELKRKQAVTDKLQALFNIAINTAVAVTKVWGQTGIFGIAAQIPVLVMGALEAAMVLGRKIPKFAKGTKNAPGGLAVVGDAGAELTEQDDKFSLIEKPTLTYLKPGAKVYTNRETKQIFASAGKDDFMVKRAIDNQTNSIVEAIINKREYHFSTRGITIAERGGTYFKEYINRKIEL